MESARLLNKPKEREILKAILEYLTLKGYLCWRNNTGGFKNSKGHFFKFGLVGSGDILGLSRGGTFFSIEVKVPGKVPTPAQVQFMKDIIKNNGIAFVAYSVDDVEKRL